MQYPHQSVSHAGQTQPFAHFCICSLPVRPGSQCFFPLHHSNNIFFFLLTLCIFSTPTDDEIAVHSLEKRSQSKFCKNRARCCLRKRTYLRLSINTAVRAGVIASKRSARTLAAPWSAGLTRAHHGAAIVAATAISH